MALAGAYTCSGTHTYVHTHTPHPPARPWLHDSQASTPDESEQVQSVDVRSIAPGVSLVRSTLCGRALYEVEYNLKHGTTDNTYVIKVGREPGWLVGWVGALCIGRCGMSGLCILLWQHCASLSVRTAAQ